jgi:parallel beta helix pectate lyase-like protein/uncharacterized protein DUF1565
MTTDRSTSAPARHLHFRPLALALAAVLVASALTATTSPPEAAAAARGVDAAGSAPVGSASYAAPANAVFAAPSGSDAAAGTSAAPVRTLARAIALAPSSGTVVLRAGTYPERIVLTKRVTIQNAPGEEVWLDGSTPVTGWVKDGARWRKDGWTTRFDHSPTYTQGAPDSTAPGWQFVNPTLAPMAAHPDQVWVAGARQSQKKTLGEVGAGSFYLDEATSKLYLGSDPTGKEVRASTLAQALSVRAPGVVVRGIGIRRYAPSVWHMGAVVLEQPNAVLENVLVTDMATTGISVLNRDSRLTNVTSQWAGMLGIHSRFADNIVYHRVRANHNNAEHFNPAPNSGGLKIGQSRGVTVTESAFVDNFSQGFWTDLSVYNTVIRGSDFSRNTANGLFLEISARAVVVDSTFLHNTLDGIKVNNTSNVKIWNNTIIGNARSVWLAQDTRRNTNPDDPAVDPRVPFPDPEMPWELQDVELGNNVIGLPAGSTNCVLCVEDYSQQESAEAMGIFTNGNLYNRASSGSPQWLVVWSRGAGNPAVHTTLDSFRAATGREARSREYVGTVVVNAAGALSQTVAATADQVALPLPADVAGIAGKPVGSQTLGAWVAPAAITTPTPTPTPTPSPTPTTTPTAPAAVVGRDTFTRTVSGGWGSADVGGAWTIATGADRFSTSNGSGQMRLLPGDGFAATLNSLQLTTTDLTVATSEDRFPDAVGHYRSLIGRSVGTTGDYRVKVRTAADGTVAAWLIRRVGNVETVLTSATHPTLQVTPGQTMTVRLRVSGQGTTTLQAKAWAAGTTEPAAWWLTATDTTTSLQSAGSPGLYTYSNGSDNGQPVTFFWDALEIRNG